MLRAVDGDVRHCRSGGIVNGARDGAKNLLRVGWQVRGER